CTAAVASVTINAGTSNATFYFKDTLAGTPTLTAAASGLASATQAETVNAAAASKLAFLSSPQTLAAGTCSARVTLQTPDAYGNPSNVGTATSVSLSSSSPGGTFYANSVCGIASASATVAAGTNTTTFYYGDTRAGTPTLTAAATGFTSGTQVETINAAT